jgi:hypothetical protein
VTTETTTETTDEKIIEFRAAAELRPARRSAFVRSDRWVIWEMPDGRIDEGDEAAYRAARDSLPEEDRGEVNAVWTDVEMGAFKKSVVTDATIRIGRSIGDDVIVDGKVSMDMAFYQGAYQMALLLHNVQSWVGPMFRDANGGAVPCRPDSINRLDPGDPLVQRVVQSLMRRNGAGRRSPDPNSRGASGSSGAGSASSTAG